MMQVNYPTEAIAPATTRQKIPDVAAIRAGCRKGPHVPTQAAFADELGISVKTLRNWEQGKRKPSGPALVLLRLLERDPQVIEKIRG